MNQFNEALQKIPAFVVGQSTEKLVSLCLSLKVFIYCLNEWMNDEWKVYSLKFVAFINENIGHECINKLIMHGKECEY